MIWVVVFGAIALAGLVVIVSYGVWLAHRVADVASELAVLGAQAGQLGELLAQVEVPPAGLGTHGAPGPRTVVRADHGIHDVG